MTTMNKTPEMVEFEDDLRMHVLNETKYEDMEVWSNKVAQQYAVEWAAHLSDDAVRHNDYLFQMREQALDNGLTYRQARGVLNCVLADMRRSMQRAMAPKPAPDSNPTIDHGFTLERLQGTFTLEWDENGQKTHKTLRFREGQGEAEGTLFIAFLSGSDNETAYTTFAYWRKDDRTPRLTNRFKTPAGAVLLGAAVALAGDKTAAKEAGFSWASQSGRCYVCSRKLTTPESIRAGIGPDCAERWS